MSEKNKWALPPGAQEQIGPKWRCRAPDGSAHLFLYDSITDMNNLLNLLEYFDSLRI